MIIIVYNKNERGNSMKAKYVISILIIALVLLVPLVACNHGKVEDNNGSSVEKPIEYTREEIMKDFRNILKSKNEPVILVEFINENIDEVEKEDAIEMIRALESAQIEYMEKYTDEMFVEDYQTELIGLWDSNSEGSLFLDIEKLEEIQNENLKELLEKLEIGKYKLITLEGAFYPIIDYEALKKYNKYLDDETKDYLDIKALESNEPSIIDAGIYISLDELANRLIMVENYIKKYPESIKNEELLRIYSSYLKLYLNGSDNSPIYNYEDNIILEDVLNSYKRTAKNQDSITGEIVGRYIEIIQENNNIIDDNVLSKITECHNKAIAELEGNK